MKPLGEFDSPRAAVARRMFLLLGVPVLCGTAFFGGALVASSGNDTEAAPAPLTARVSKLAPSENLALAGKLEQTGAVSVEWKSGEPGVVTALPLNVGDAAVLGRVVAEINGRPKILLSGELPAYRDLLPGATGPDVTQLTTALAEVGLLPAAQETYDAATAAAVRALFEKNGYAPPEPSSEAAAQLRSVREEQRGASVSEEARGSSTQEAKIAVDRAERALNLAKARRDDVHQATTSTREDLQRQIDANPVESDASAEAARQLRELNLASAGQERDADEAVTSANEDLRLATSRLAETQGEAAGSADVDIDERLREAEVAADTPFPAREVVYTQVRETSVTSVLINLGDTVQGAFMTIGAPTLSATLDGPGDVDVAPGALALVSGPQGQLAREVPVTAVTRRTDDELQVTVTLFDPGSFKAGDDVTVSLPIATAAQPLDTVPRSAVFADSDGRLYVNVLEGDQVNRTEVRQLSSSAGTLSIEAVDGADLDGKSVIVELERR